ncbi:unnamed protein product [Mesocestoides corti]|uniref:Kynureninase n=1 Tax=Mesocestoides corti TaxID=53468 RepID=A0A0R3U8C5_MESCO|nr:unnamed protein product [Mesocestoides corti]
MESLEALASALDGSDPLKEFRQRFILPTLKALKGPVGETNGHTEEANNGDIDSGVIYLCTNSLGLPPKATGENLAKVLDAWGSLGVLSHTKGISPTEISDIRPKQLLAEFLVGAKFEEVAVMESLTANIHTLVSSFFVPKGKKSRILIEKNSFPSDYYAIESQLYVKGVDKSALIELDLRPNGKYLSTEEIVEEIKRHGEVLAFVWLPGVQYLTGQMLDIRRITAAVHEYCDCPIGWDLAHAVGNVPLSLHDWKVDCATWCGYKYLCGSPGGYSAIFVHEKHHLKAGSHVPTDKHAYGPSMSGWWGHRYSTRFQMTNKMETEAGADAYRRSCPSMLLNSALTSALEVFAEAGGMKPIREKSIKLTNFLENLLTNGPYALPPDSLEIITPADPDSRGSQLSLKINVDVDKLYRRLIDRGVVCDTRKPCYVRVAPFALYTSFTDVLKAAKIIHEEVNDLIDDNC